MKVGKRVSPSLGKDLGGDFKKAWNSWTVFKVQCFDVKNKPALVSWKQSRFRCHSY